MDEYETIRVKWKQTHVVVSMLTFSGCSYRHTGTILTTHLLPLIPFSLESVGFTYNQVLWFVGDRKPTHPQRLNIIYIYISFKVPMDRHMHRRYYEQNIYIILISVNSGIDLCMSVCPFVCHLLVLWKYEKRNRFRHNCLSVYVTATLLWR